jgi:hypothetical protein
MNTVDRFHRRTWHNVGATDEVIASVARELGQEFPSDYVRLIHETNGIEGFLDGEQYVIFFPVTDLPKLNRAANVAEFAPSFLIIGSDGGGTSYGIVGGGKYGWCNSETLSDDEVIVVGETLDDLLAAIARDR